jgi:hypothetical protein
LSLVIKIRFGDWVRPYFYGNPFHGRKTVVMPVTNCPVYCIFAISRWYAGCSVMACYPVLPEREITPTKTLMEGIPRNYEVFDPLDFLAEVTHHIPNKGEHLPAEAAVQAGQIRYYGWFSNKKRGMQEKNVAALGQPEQDTAFRRRCRMTWAALIKCVYEVDPLKCPKCGGEMWFKGREGRQLSRTNPCRILSFRKIEMPISCPEHALGNKQIYNTLRTGAGDEDSFQLCGTVVLDSALVLAVTLSTKLTIKACTAWSK